MDATGGAAAAVADVTACSAATVADITACAAAIFVGVTACVAVVTVVNVVAVPQSPLLITLSGRCGRR